jgi:hypothetical protein
VQGRVPARILEVGVGPVPQQQQERLGQPELRSEVHRRLPAVVLRVDVRAVLQEHRSHLHQLPRDLGQAVAHGQERRLPMRVPPVRVGALDQHAVRLGDFAAHDARVQLLATTVRARTALDRPAIFEMHKNVRVSCVGAL